MLPKNKSGCMKRIITCFIVVSGVLFCAFSAGAASEPRQFVEELLIAEGLDPSQERGMMQDPRVSIHPEIIIKNLFFSSPKGTAGKPDVMEVHPRQIKQGKAFMKERAGISGTHCQSFEYRSAEYFGIICRGAEARPGLFYYHGSIKE